MRRQFRAARNPMVLGSFEAGGYHDMPENLPDVQLFYVYRSPASWYRSLWCSREAMSWRLVLSDSPKWDKLCDLLNDLGAPGTSFPEFVELVTTKHPGLMTEVYRWYTSAIPTDVVVHAVELGRLTDYVGDLLKPYSIPVDLTSVGASKNPPKITDELVAMIEESEAEYVHKFGTRPASKKGEKRVKPDRSDNPDGAGEDTPEHVLADSDNGPALEDDSIAPSPAVGGTGTGTGDITSRES